MSKKFMKYDEVSPSVSFKMIKKDIYLKIVLDQMHRILSLCNRNSLSPTKGCFDRDFWHYKRVDTPFSRMQEIVLTLTLLYKNKAKGNIYYQNKNILEIIKSGVDYWVKLQHKDGSFSDFYPNERAIVITAFTLYAISEALFLLPEIKKGASIKAIKKAACFLSKNVEKKAINQEISSMTSIISANRILKKKSIEKIIQKKVRFILSKQSKEGWFEEFGGADIGYLSVGIDYLAKAHKLGEYKNKDIKKALDKAIEFISYFIHPDGSVGGEYSSRNTQYILPHGIEIVSKQNSIASAIKEKLIETLDKKTTTSLYSMDDRYMALYSYSFLQAYFEDTRSIKMSKLPYEKKPFEKHFKEANIFIKKTNNYYLVVGLSKGGTIKIFDINKPHTYFSDSGYSAILKKKKISSSCFNSKRSFLIKNDFIIVRGRFTKIKYVLSSPFKHVVLRLITISPLFAKITRDLIRNKLISKGNDVPVRFKRIIELKQDSIKITDFIKSKEQLKKLTNNDIFSYRYIPSAQYFNKHDLLSQKLRYKNSKDFKVVKTIEIKTNKLTLNVYNERKN